MQRFYVQPTDTRIADYETELIELLKCGYLDTMTIGFKRDGNWIEPTLRYKARDLGSMQSADEDPGKVRPGADVSGASFYSFTTYTNKWDELTSAERDARRECRSIEAARMSPVSRVTWSPIELTHRAAKPSTGLQYGATNESTSLRRSIRTSHDVSRLRI
jgi:hypothetical protein